MQRLLGHLRRLATEISKDSSESVNSRMFSWTYRLSEEYPACPERSFYLRLVQGYLQQGVSYPWCSFAITFHSDNPFALGYMPAYVTATFGDEITNVVVFSKGESLETLWDLDVPVTLREPVQKEERFLCHRFTNMSQLDRMLAYGTSTVRETSLPDMV